MKPFWRAREFSTMAILAIELLFFAWYLWPADGGSHPFFRLKEACWQTYYRKSL